MEYLSNCCGATPFGEIDTDYPTPIGQCIRCNGNTVFYPFEEE